ncbi:MAG: hypothetical protein IKP65_05680 [Alphaproteobacteria bacterium]|nr:hypothetical protein [Alphaproteobacteria bacterium]
MNKSNENYIKVGTFQLQTKSFWISMTAILCLFMFAVIWMNYYYCYKMLNASLEANKKVIELQINKRSEK